MYTHEIISQANGIATVSFFNGETETYTEQVIVSEAQFATEDTPFIPPVYEIIEHIRPKTITATFPDDESLEAAIQARLDALNTPPQPDPVVEPPTAEELARDAWLEQWRIYEKANRAMKALEEAGFEPTEEETTRFNTLKTWVGKNRKPEYSQYI